MRSRRRSRTPSSSASGLASASSTRRASPARSSAARASSSRTTARSPRPSRSSSTTLRRAKRRLTASSCRRNPPGERLALDASTPLSQLSRLFSTPIPCFSPSTTPLCDHAPTPLCPIPSPRPIDAASLLLPGLVRDGDSPTGAGEGGNDGCGLSDVLSGWGDAVWVLSGRKEAKCRQGCARQPRRRESSRLVPCSSCSLDRRRQSTRLFSLATHRKRGR